MKKLFFTKNIESKCVFLIWIFTSLLTLFFLANPDSLICKSNKHRVIHLKKGAYNNIPTQIQKININLASQNELIQLEGVGPVLAKRIVDYRNAHGPFHSLKGLSQVKGLGQKKLAKINQQIKL
ncbi:MAG: helix-hairpin-helix domain-containing protein [Candidatus Caenarcaniphilales bacterium]|nr:helix-hairpin-helix domain-containing protein [Candidatus Caenarcaniphilales bacterium]